jgi:hypothetical protein
MKMNQEVSMWDYIDMAQKRVQQKEQEEAKVSHQCNCAYCGQTERCIRPFPHYIQMALYYDMVQNKILGPYSLGAIHLDLEKVKTLDMSDGRTQRAVSDRETVYHLDTLPHVICIYWMY